MGIKGLAKLLSDEAPDCIRDVELKSLHGRKIAIDASMAIYQFLIAVRSSGQYGAGAGGGGPGAAMMLTNADGETTSHIQGMFNRTIRYMSEGIRPVYVFDGKPPDMKSFELQKRREKRQKALEAHKQAEEEGNVEELDKQSKRLVRAGHKENQDCQKLLELMGVPVIIAPCEAEAQAAALARSGQVYATGTEDMDALTYRTPVLVRKMTFASSSSNSSGNKSNVQTINYQKAVEGLGITHEQFVDLCILLGCDYCDTIKGVGPKTALKLIREHGTIEKILSHLDSKKFTVPDSWLVKKKGDDKEKKKTSSKDDDEDDNESPNQGLLEGEIEEKKAENDKENNDNDGGDEEEEEDVVPAYVQARRLFLQHDVMEKFDNMKWKPCQPDALMKYLVDDMGFSPDRVKSSIEKLQAAHKANTKPQTRMDSFFTVKPSAKSKTPAASSSKSNNKRKSPASSSAASKKGKGFKKR